MAPPGFEPGSRARKVFVEKDVLDGFIKFMIKQGLREETAKGYFYKIRKLLRNIGFVWDKDLIINYLQNFEGNTLGNYKKAIKWFEKYLKSLGHEVSIYEEIKDIGGWSREYGTIFDLITDLTEDNVKKGFHNISFFIGKCFYAFLTVTGVRRGEALNLRVRYLKLDKRIVVWPREFQRRTKKVYGSFITDEVRDFLDELITKYGLKQDDRVFNISCKQVKTIFKQASLNNMKITAQELRKFFATYSAMNGMPGWLIDFLQGRIGPSVLAKHYIKYSLEELRPLYDKVWNKFRFYN